MGVRQDISVVVSTRNRPDQVIECVRAILANTDPAFELVVVDQSTQATPLNPEAVLGPDPRLRWLMTPTSGLSVSRNIGLAATTGSIVAFTDDDCRVSPDWLDRIRRAFDADDELALLFGAVVLSPQDRARGYAAEFEPTEAREFHRVLPDMRSNWGVGANMAIRRTVFERVGTFDLMLGAGARFYAAEEIDVTIRAIAAGFKVAHTPEIRVRHLGVREGPAASRLVRGYGIGLGATLAKHVRLGTPDALRLLMQWGSVHARKTMGNVMRGSRHPGFGLLTAVAWGVCRSCSVRIDVDRSAYRV